MPCEELAPEAAAERWPNLRFEGTVVHQPLGGRCRADATVAALTRRAADHGADVRFGVGPVAVELAGDGAVVTLGDERIEARTVVVTAGAWLARTAGTLVDLPPLSVTEEQVVHFPPAVEPRSPTEWPSFIHHTERFWYGLPTPGSGVKVGGHHEGAEVDPDRRRGTVDPAYAEGLRALRRALAPRRRPGAAGGGHLPVHDHARHPLPARPGRPGRRRVPLLRPRLQVRPPDRPDPG